MRVFRLWWALDLVDLVVFDSRKDVRRLIVARASYLWLSTEFPSFPNLTYHRQRGILPFIFPVLMVGSWWGLGMVIGVYLRIWPVLLLLPFGSPVLGYLGIRLGAALSPKRMAVLRMDSSGHLVPLNAASEVIPDAPTPEYLADYGDMQTLRHRMMGPPEGPSPLIVGTIIMGLLGMAVILWFFFAAINDSSAGGAV